MVLFVLKIILRNLAFFIWLVADLRFLRVFRRGIAAARAAGDAEEERQDILNTTRLWGKRLSEKLRIDRRIEREAALPDGPLLFVSNHESYADIPIFCAAIQDKQMGFVAKKSLCKLPLFGSWIRDIRSIFIERGDARSSLKAMDEGVDLLQQGFSLVIFPEGTRSKGGPMGAFKKGSLRLAVKAAVPVVPVTHKGGWKIFEENGRPAQGVEVRFCVHRPIETAGLSKQEAGALSETVEGIIRAKLEEWEPDKTGAPAECL
jgi:1-acyl-sn-glycerol-3-phosphate acyltransferase